MAARRLMLALLAVIAISTVATAVLAPRADRDPEPPTAANAQQSDLAAKSGPGRLIETTVHAGDGRAERIRLRPGDQLELTVHSRTPRQVEITRFGLLEDAGPGAPAHFSLLADQPAAFEVRLAATGRAIAHVVVRRGPVEARNRGEVTRAQRGRRSR